MQTAERYRLTPHTLKFDPFMFITQHRLQFLPRLVPTLAALAMVSLTLYLAWWQQGRAEQKRVLQAAFTQRTAAPALVLDATQRDGAAIRYRRAIAHGTFNRDGQIFLDNKTDDASTGRAGYHVITPLRLNGSSTYVLVNRGWLPRTGSYPKPPIVAVPAGEVEVRGLAAIPNAHFLELSNAAVEGTVWQNLTMARYQQQMKLDVLPVMLLASNTTPDALQGLKPISEQPNTGMDKHIEYMLTWYSLSATIVALWIGLNLKIKPVNAPSKPSAPSPL